MEYEETPDEVRLPSLVMKSKFDTIYTFNSIGIMCSFVPQSLRQIFSSIDLSVNDLKNCRLVCKSWRDEATPLFFECSILRPNKYDVEEKNELGGLWEFFRDNVASPFTHPNLHLDEHFMDKGRLEQGLEWIQDWLKVKGDLLRGLRYNFTENKATHQVFMKVLSCAPNLENLKIIVNNYPDIVWSHEFTIQNVRKLIVEDSTWQRNSDDDSDDGYAPRQEPTTDGRIFPFYLFTTRRKFLLDPQPFALFLRSGLPFFTKLECLSKNSYNSVISTAISNSIREQPHKLKHLKIEYGSLLQEEIDDYLQIPANTLHSLVLEDCRVRSTARMNGSIVRFLETHAESLCVAELKIVIDHRWGDGDSRDSEDEDEEEFFPFVPLHVSWMTGIRSLEIGDIFHLRAPNLFIFLSKLPNLRRVVLENAHTSPNVYPMTPDEYLESALTIPAEQEYLKHASLRSFNLYGALVKPAMVENIVKMFPNLKELSVQVYSDEVLGRLFDLLRRELKELELLFVEMKGLVETHCAGNSICIGLQAMPRLRTLGLYYYGNTEFDYYFQCSKKFIDNGICEASSLRSLTLKSFAFPEKKMDSIIRRLRLQCTSVKLVNCAVISSRFNLDYNHTDYSN